MENKFYHLSVKIMGAPKVGEMKNFSQMTCYPTACECFSVIISFFLSVIHSIFSSVKKTTQKFTSFACPINTLFNREEDTQHSIEGREAVAQETDKSKGSYLPQGNVYSKESR